MPAPSSTMPRMIGMRIDAPVLASTGPLEACAAGVVVAAAAAAAAAGQLALTLVDTAVVSDRATIWLWFACRASEAAKTRPVSPLALSSKPPSPAAADAG